MPHYKIVKIHEQQYIPAQKNWQINDTQTHPLCGISLGMNLSEENNV
jgi:hypothetical protein